MALYRDLTYFSRDFAVYFRRALALLDGAMLGPVVPLSRFHRLLTVKLSGLPDLSVASICGPRVSRGMRAFEPHQCGGFRGTSPGAHLGCLLASGPALALVLHLPMKCGSRPSDLKFRCRIVSREKGYCVNWGPLGVERVACMTAACLKTLAVILSNKVVLVIALTPCHSVYVTVFLCYLQYCRGIYLLYKGWVVQSWWTL